jgi:hypothetical protein
MSWVAVNSPEEVKKAANPGYDRDQLILRIGAMSVVGKKIPLAVRNSYALKGPSTHQEHYSPPKLPQTPPAQPQFLSPQPIFHGRGTPGVSEDGSVDLANFTRWAEEAIDGQKQDIDRISAIVEKIEKDMHGFQDFLGDIRRQFQFVPKSSRVEQIGRDLSALQDEVLDLRGLPQTRIDRPVKASGDGFAFNADELDALSASISNISHKANEVDGLKIELQFVKTRLKRLEDAGRNASHATQPDALLSAGNFEQRPRIGSMTSMNASIVHRQQQSHSKSSDRRTSNGIEDAKRRRSSQHHGVDEDHALDEDPISMDHPHKRGRHSETSAQLRGSSYATNPQPSRLSEAQYADELNSEDLQYEETPNDEEFESPPTLRDQPLQPKPQHKALQNVLSSSRRMNYRNTAPSLEIEITEDSTPEPQTDTESAGRESRNDSKRDGRSLSRNRGRSTVGSRSQSGVRLTKHGKPDKRAGNYRNLKAYYERLRSSEESDAPRAEGGDTVGRQQMQAKFQGQANGKGRDLRKIARNSMRNDPKVVNPVEMRIADIEGEDLRKIALEARDRLVKETLAREIQ